MITARHIGLALILALIMFGAGTFGVAWAQSGDLPAQAPEYGPAHEGAIALRRQRNDAPVARTGESRSAVIGERIILDGASSTDLDGDRLTYSWSLDTPQGSGAVLDDPHAVRPSFIVDLLGDYTATLVVADKEHDSKPASVRVTTGNVAPVADAGDDRRIRVGETILLDAGASHDADGDALSYRWALERTPTGSRAALTGVRAQTPAFTADQPGRYVVGLTANDGHDDSEPDLQVLATQNLAPAARAGDDRSALAGTAVRLFAGDSSDANGDRLEFAWSLLHTPDGSWARLQDARGVAPLLLTDLPGIYVAQVVASDGQHRRADTVVIDGLTGGAYGVMPPRSHAHGLVSLGGGGSDIDGDGVPDDVDNCVETPNPDQIDTNSDGFGNRCDPDLDNDGLITNTIDLGLLRLAFFSRPGDPNWNPDADFDGNGVVNVVELGILKFFFFNAPGPIANTFINPAGGSWHEPTNWSLGVVPNAAHAVRIDLDPGVTVEFSAGSTQISSIRTTSPLTLSGGTLNITRLAEFNDTVTLSNNVTLKNAPMVPPTVNPNATIAIPVSATATLDGVILANDVNVSNSANLIIQNGLTLDGATITLLSDGSTTNLTVSGPFAAVSTIDGTGDIVFSGTTASSNRNRVFVSGSTHGLTIGSGVTVRTGTTGGQILHANGNGPITIQGTIVSDVADRSIYIEGFPLTLEGTIALNNGTVELSGTFPQNDFGTVTGTGTIALTGLLDITGQTLDLGSIPPGVTVQLDSGGTLLGGTLTGGALTLPSSAFTFDGITLGVDVDISNSANLIIQNGLTLDGATITLLSGGSTTNLTVSGPAAAVSTIDGTGDIVFSGTTASSNRNRVFVSGSTHGLTIGSGVTVRTGTTGGQILHANGNGPITIQGTIVSDVADRSIYIEGFPLTLEGTIALNNGTVELSGTFPQNDFGTVTGTGTIALTGLLDITGQTLDLGSIPPGVTVQLDSGGTLLGGTLTGGALTLPSSTFTFDGITLGVDVDISNSANLIIQNGLTLDGATITLLSGGSTTNLTVSGPAAAVSTIDGTGDIVFSGTTASSNRNRVFVSGSTHGLTIGSGVTVRTGTTGGQILHANGNGPITIQGTIVSDVADRSIYIEGFPLTLEGTIALNNGTVELSGTFPQNDFGTVTGTGTIALTGLLDITGQTLDLGSIPPGVTVQLDSGGTLLGGTLTGGALTLPSSTFTFDGITLGVDVDISNSANLIIQNGLTLDGATITLLSGGSTTSLTVSGPAVAVSTIDGTGDIVFSGTTASSTRNRVIVSGSTHGLTIGSGVTVRTGTTGGQILHANGNGPITIQGTIVSDVADRSIYIEGFPLTLEGTIALNNGTVELSGTFPQNDFGTVTGTGTIALTGLLDITGQTLDLGSIPPGVTVQLDSGGTLLGGTLTGGALTLPSSTFTFDGITLGVDVDISNSANLIIQNGLTLDGATITLLSGGSTTNLTVSGPAAAVSTIDGTGDIVFSGTTASSNRNRVFVSGSTHGLTIGSGVTVRTGTTGGQILHANGNGPITIQGTIVADVADRSIFINGFPLTIEGSLHIGAGSVIDLSDYTLTASASVDLDVGGTDSSLFGRITASVHDAGLSGTLNLALVNGFSPTLADLFEILTFASHTGTFNTVNGTAIGGGLSFQPNYNITDVTLEVVN